MKTTTRYAFKSSANLLGAVAGGGLTYFLAEGGVNSILMAYKVHFSDAAAPEIKKFALDHGFGSSSKECETRAKVKASTTATTISPAENQAYLSCMSTNKEVHAAPLFLTFAATIGYMSLKAFMRSSAYAHLAATLSKSKGEDVSFKLLSKQELRDLEATDATIVRNNGLKMFSITNGVSPHASLIMEAGEVAYSERGAFLAKSTGIEMQTTVRDKGQLKAALSGESLMRIQYTNTADEPQELLLNPAKGQQLTEVSLSTTHGPLFCQNGAFFASSAPVDISLAPIRNLSFRIFSGQGLSFQKITQQNPPASVLLASAGQLTQRDLVDGESYDIQHASLFALTGNITLELREIAGLFNRVGSGEKGFMTRVTGPGTVWLNTPAPSAPEKKRKSSLKDLNPTD